MPRVWPIGLVRSAIKTGETVPPLGVPASVELFPQYAPGLHRMEKHSHVWVLAWLETAERDLLQVTPRGVSARGAAALHGVFAVRSPARPNPIGLTVARLLRHEGARLEFDRLDFRNGTPVIDLKPYFPNRDPVFSAASGQIGRPANVDALRLSLLDQAARFHGEVCEDVERAAAVLAAFRGDILAFADPDDWRITVPIGRPHLIDAVMGATRLTPGRGNLRFHVLDALVIEHAGARYEYSVS
ncbi:MAG: tRNA (N6-threonylcarbamoyladenosine(37)-N6)-methyltransferase TrmO [Bryobacterales bacterium]|nr:tRNA (N6-threonylcarbamoyladenosine(37)-N6)-methyltransferase TrmO [Bryobacterales bacterium]